MKSRCSLGRRALLSVLALALAPGSAGAGPVALAPVVAGLDAPVYVTHARDGSGRLFIVEQPGRIKVLQPGAAAPTVFLDLSSRVRYDGEQGLLGLAFHPQFATNGRFFVNYTRATNGNMVVAEHRVWAADPDVAEAAGTVILSTPQPFANHKGGMIEFGPDGFLYVALGDGGSGNDPGDRAQDPGTLLGKILRIDVDDPRAGARYASPPSNPFAGGGGRPEIFALGFRNPYRFSFDRATGLLYAGDVGQGAREEIAVVALGQNHGWRVWEGTRCTGLGPGDCTPAGYTFPVAEYASDDPLRPRCAVIGGYAYRGGAGALPPGAYVHGDFCSGEIFVLDGAAWDVALAETGLAISSFGEDETGEVLVADLNGAVYRIVSSGAPCGYLVAPAGASFPAAGAAGASLAVAASPGCAWTAVSNAPWLTVTGGASGAGPGTVTFDVAPSARGTVRKGTLTVAGRAFTVTQDGVPCTFSVAPRFVRAPVAGGPVRIAVTTPKGCAWTAESRVAWLPLTAGSPGRGPGSATFQAPARAGFVPRAGSVTVAGQSVFVIQ